MAIERLGPYRIEKLLGRGGMGAVYAGVNEATGERAAIKVLAGHLADNTDFRERFTAEVETLKKLKHPNIVQLLAYGEEEEHLFYVMELVEGRSLQDELQSGRRFDWREVAKVGVDVCRALKHAHDSGVIHRDLKPANLLLDRQNQVKLTDFGIAKLYGGTQITAAGGILGTADYMSPEQAEGKPVNARSDLYSLGSVLFALLAGRPPFASKSLAEVIHGLRFEKPIGVRRLAPDCPEQFESIIAQLLEKDPAKRIASAFALANYLRAMEHALSMETQVGDVSLDSLPPDAPLTGAPPPHPLTKVGVTDATIVTSSPNLSAGTVVGPGATAEIREPASSDEYRLSSADVVTVVPRAGTQVESRNTAVSGTAVEEPPAVKRRFITMEEEEALRRKKQRREEDGPPIWALIGGMCLAVAILVGLVIFAMQPPSADSLYAKIAAAAEPGDIEKLQEADDEIDQFLKRFPDDPRTNEIEGYRSEVDTAKQQRKFELQARFGLARASTPASEAYLEAVKLAEDDPEKAVGRFEAIVAVFDGFKGADTAETKSAEQCVELSRQQIATLKEKVAETAKSHRAIITARLKEAGAKQKDDPAEAIEIYRGIAALYGDKAWAKDLVDQAHEKLAALDEE